MTPIRKKPPLFFPASASESPELEKLISDYSLWLFLKWLFFCYTAIAINEIALWSHFGRELVEKLEWLDRSALGIFEHRYTSYENYYGRPATFYLISIVCSFICAVQFLRKFLLLYNATVLNTHEKIDAPIHSFIGLIPVFLVSYSVFYITFISAPNFSGPIGQKVFLLLPAFPALAILSPSLTIAPVTILLAGIAKTCHTFKVKSN